MKRVNCAQPIVEPTPEPEQQRGFESTLPDYRISVLNSGVRYNNGDLLMNPDGRVMVVVSGIPVETGLPRDLRPTVISSGLPSMVRETSFVTPPAQRVFEEKESTNIIMRWWHRVTRRQT